MKKKKNSQKTQDDIDQNDLNQHGVKDIIPDNEEYYTLDLKRGDDLDIDDIPEIDIADKDPASDDMDEPLKSSSFYEGQVVQKNNNKPHSSNDGGTVNQDDVLEQDGVSRVPGSPGGNIDEDTG